MTIPGRLVDHPRRQGDAEPPVSFVIIPHFTSGEKLSDFRVNARKMTSEFPNFRSQVAVPPGRAGPGQVHDRWRGAHGERYDP